MEVSDELIKSFLNHTCSPAEAAMVAHYLKENPEVAEKFIPLKEWNETSEYSSESEDFWEEQWNAIEKKRSRGKRVFMAVARNAAAVALIFVAGYCFQYFFSKNTRESAPISQAIPEDSIKDIENKDNKPLLVVLPDKSAVELMPGSKISYKTNFDSDRRDINLTGEAVFEVAKDSLRPFTVYSGSISTTALGTKFKVTYSRADSIANVYLYEGKVLIQSYYNHKIQKAYLLPGDNLSFNPAEGKMLVRRSEVPSNKNEKSAYAGKLSKHSIDRTEIEDQADDQPVIAVRVPMWYRFEKESLSNVFDQLADIYNAKISYEEKELESKYFIGKFEQTQSLADILRTIARINELQVEEVSTTHYIIKKK